MADKDKSKEQKTTDIKDLAKYEHAALAENLESGSEERRQYAPLAMLKFYSACGIDKEDPIIINAINTGGIKQAIAVYAGKFKKALSNTKFGDFCKYVSDKGYKIAGSVKDEFDKISKKYGSLVIGALGSKAKEDKDAQRASMITGTLLNQVLEGALYGKLVTENTNRDLEGILAKAA